MKIDAEFTPEEVKLIIGLLNLVKEKFTSGNDIPVERITITRQELQNFLDKE